MSRAVRFVTSTQKVLEGAFELEAAPAHKSGGLTNDHLGIGWQFPTGMRHLVIATKTSPAMMSRFACSREGTRPWRTREKIEAVLSHPELAGDRQDELISGLDAEHRAGRPSRRCRPRTRRLR